MSDISVNVDPDAIQTAKADSRGRVNLGSEYGGEELTVAVLDRGGDDGAAEDELAECPNGCGPLVVRPPEEDDGLRRIEWVVRPPEEDDGLRRIECPECGYVGGSA